MKNLLVFYSSYSSEVIVRLRLYPSLLAMDAGNVFANVIVFNLNGALTGQTLQGKKFGKTNVQVILDKFLIIEPRPGRYSFLAKFSRINLLLSFVSGFLKLVSVCGRRKISLVRAEDPSLNGLLGFISSKFLKSKLIVGIWGNPQRLRFELSAPLSKRAFRSARVEAYLEKKIISKANLILVQNQENSLYPLSCGKSLEEIKIESLGLWIDKRFFSLPEKLVAPQVDFRRDTYKLFCLSRLEPVKMVDVLLPVISRILDSQLQVEFYFIGAGSLLNNLTKQVKEMNLENHVFFLGDKDQDWLIENLEKFDLGLAPLWGRALLEAGLRGCPVIGFNIDWHNEIIINDVTGRLVPVGAVDEFANCAIDLLKNPSLLHKFSVNIRNRALYLARRDEGISQQKDSYLKLMKK